MSRKRRSPESDESVSKKQKHYELGSDGILNLTVAITGAVRGDVLQGVVRSEGNSSNDSEGVLLEVVSGFVYASSSVCRPLSKEHIVEAYSKRYSISMENAENRYNERKMDNPESDNAHPMGSSCPSCKGVHGVYGDCNCPPIATFRIIDPGIWSEIARSFGNEEKLMRYVSEGAELSWREILALFGNKSLMLRPRLYRVVMGPRILSKADPEKAIVCVGKGMEKMVYEFPESGFQIVLNPSSAAPKISAIDLVRKSLNCSPEEEEQLAIAFAGLAGLSNGALKSAMQKAVRYGAPRVQIKDQSVPSHLYAAMACSVLALNPGGFVPQLQKMVRGVVSALKRAAVICVEDACGASAIKIKDFLGVAYVCQNVRDYYPPENVYSECIKMIAACAQSDMAIDYINQNPLGIKNVIPGIRQEKNECSDKNIRAFQQSAFLLEKLGSFGGDIRMFQEVAEMAKSGSIKAVRWMKRPEVMPDFHIMDQHTQPGIGHIICMGDAGFKERFEFLFKMLTGFNPRREPMDSIRSDIVSVCRPAQKIMLNLVTKRYPLRILEPVNRMNIQYRVDYGALASGIGPIDELVKRVGSRKKELLVVLSTIPGGKESVMLKPSRAKISDYMEWGVESQVEKKIAILQARGKSYSVKSALLPKKKASYDPAKGEWVFGGKSWSQCVQDGFSYSMDIVPDPDWSRDGPINIRNQDWLEDALACQGCGACMDADFWFEKLCESAGFAVLSRAQSLLHQQFSDFSMPVPARDGGIGIDQLQAYDGDWDVWRFLVLLSRIFPGALRPGITPRFSVPEPIVLYLLSCRLREKRSKSHAYSGLENPWKACSQWLDGQKAANSILRPHQKDAVQRLKDRDQRGSQGHYLVMDTGYGKTYTVISYAMSLILDSSFGCIVDYILWVTPPGDKIEKKGKADDPKNFQLIKSLMAEFMASEGGLVQLPIHFVDGRKAGKAVLKKFRINIINHDHMRSMSEILLKNASRSFVIFDEGDKLYNASKRTSMAFRIADLCPKFVIQTATPVPVGKIDLMAQWLARTERFPVDKSNYLVAACNMVQLKIMLPFSVRYECYQIKHSDEATRAFNDYIQDQNWFKWFQKVQDLSDPEFCDRAYKYAIEDRAIYPNGGCFVVCQSVAHVDRLMKMFQQKYPDIRCGDSMAMNDSNVGVVFVPARNDRGYNAGVRFGAQIRQPYPGSASSRHQMEGRLKRALTQQRPEIVFEVVYMQNSLAHLLYKKQQKGDNVNQSLEHLAKEFDLSQFI